MAGIANPLWAGGLSLMLLGVALLVALRLMRGLQRPGRIDDVSTLLLVGAWAMITIGGMAVVAGSLAGRNGPGLVFLLMLFVITAIAAGGLVQHFGRSRQQMLLVSLATAAERNMPLESAIEAFAADCGDPAGTRIRELAELLRAGSSLPEALARLPGLVPRESLAMIRLGYESGALADALRQAAEADTEGDRVWREPMDRIAYLLTVLVFGVGIVTFIVIKVYPQFFKIFADFNMSLPLLTRTTFGVLGGLAPFGAIIGVACLFAFPWLLGVQFRRTGWPPLCPVGLLRRLHTAAILDGLALVARCQRPLEQGIAVLAEAYPKWSIRRRLRKVLRRVKAGADPLECLAARRLLGRADLAVLQAAQRVGNLVWALGEMADSNRRRFAYRMQILGQILFPLAILALGTVVLVFIVACFLPLVALIQSLA